MFPDVTDASEITEVPLEDSEDDDGDEEMLRVVVEESPGTFSNLPLSASAVIT